MQHNFFIIFSASAVTFISTRELEYAHNDAIIFLRVRLMPSNLFFLCGTRGQFLFDHSSSSFILHSHTNYRSCLAKVTEINVSKHVKCMNKFLHASKGIASQLQWLIPVIDTACNLRLEVEDTDRCLMGFTMHFSSPKLRHLAIIELKTFNLTFIIELHKEGGSKWEKFISFIIRRKWNNLRQGAATKIENMNWIKILIYPSRPLPEKNLMHFFLTSIIPREGCFWSKGEF